MVHVLVHLVLGALALAAPHPDPGLATAAFVAPAEQSSVEGPFGVLFVPRYPDAATAQARRVEELGHLEEALAAMSPDDRARLRDAVSARLVAVRHWRGVFEDRSDDALAAEARLELLRQRDLLGMEEATLEAQLAMLGGPTPAPATVPDASPPDAARAEDRIVFGGDVLVGPTERVHDAVAFGGDVVVRGIVEGDAVAFGGDVSVPQGGHVLGEATSIGGGVASDDAGAIRARTSVGPSWPARVRPGRPGPLAWLVGWAIPFLALAGAGVLTVGLLPERVDRVAAAVTERPLATAATGALGMVAFSVAAVIFAITILGIPVALALMAVLAAAWLLGLVAFCTALGARLNLGEGARRRWVSFLIGVALVALVAAVPFVGHVALLAASLFAVGAALTTRFGAA